MKSVKIFASSIMFLGIFLTLGAAGSFAQQTDSAAGISARLTSIEQKIKKVEEGQAEILENQKQILEAIQNLRVWVRRS